MTNMKNYDGSKVIAFALHARYRSTHLFRNQEWASKKCILYCKIQPNCSMSHLRGFHPSRFMAMR